MDKRIGKIIIGQAGGTASKGSETYKISLPTKWIKEMNLKDNQVEMEFDGEKIVISPRLNLNDFVVRKKSQNHRLMLLSFYNADVMCSKICADFSEEKIAVENYTDNIVKTAFGKNKYPGWNDFQNFLKERCVPESRSGIREYLETIGVESFDPVKIIEKTKGRMAEDNQWLKMEWI